MTDFNLKTPVAFFIYKRPDATKQSFGQIRKAKPAKLLVIADGPKNSDEEQAVEEARGILKEIDWNCQVLTNLSDVNMGCKKRFISGLKWVFSQCEEAIIIEDDIVVSPSLFRYVQELLDYYREDDSVFTISGCNIGFEGGPSKNSYSFSRFMNMWGWATWRRAYNKIDFEMRGWDSFKKSDAFKKSLLTDRSGKWEKYWIKKFDKASYGKIDTWDYQWIYSQLSHNGITIVPVTNMVKNIGYGEIATHTENSEHMDSANLSINDITFPLVHPKEIKNNNKYEKYIIRNWCHIKIPTLYEITRDKTINIIEICILSPTRKIRGVLGIRRHQITARRYKRK